MFSFVECPNDHYGAALTGDSTRIYNPFLNEQIEPCQQRTLESTCNFSANITPNVLRKGSKLYIVQRACKLQTGHRARASVVQTLLKFQILIVNETIFASLLDV